MNIDLQLIKNALSLFAKSFLILLGLIATASVADAGIYKKILGSETSGYGTTTLII